MISLLPPLVLPALAAAGGILLAWHVPIPALWWVVIGVVAAVMAWAAPPAGRGISSVGRPAAADTSSPAGTEPARSPARTVPARSRARTIVWLAVAWMSVGALRLISVRELPAHHVAWLVDEQPAPVAMRGVVVDDPVELVAPAETFDSSSTRIACALGARDVHAHGRWRPVTGRVRAVIHQPRPPRGAAFPRQQGSYRLGQPRHAFEVGDSVLLEGRWSRPPSAGNPGQYDWRASLARHHIYAVLTVQPFDGMVTLDAPSSARMRRGIAWVRHRLEQLLDTFFTPPRAALLRSFLLGQRVALDDSLKRAFIETGTMHLVVISGFNVGLIALLLEGGGRLVGVEFRARLLLTAVGLWGYCLLAGLQPPVVRATIMGWCVLGALWLDRRIDWPNLLAMAVLIMVWINPLELGDASFQLSFGAVASLLVFEQRFQAFIEPTLLWLPEGRMRRAIAVSLASTLAIWVGLWPLLAWYFHLISPVSILANLVLVPLVSAMVVAGTVILGAGLVMPAMVGWTGSVLSALVDAVVWCAHGLHHVPGGWWPVGAPSIALMAGYYVLVGLSLLRRRMRWPMSRVVICWVAGASLWCWSALAARVVQAHWLEMTVLDVGHGDSVVVRTPNRQTVVIDAGTPEAGAYVVVPFLRARGWSTVDALLLTHPDADHVGGAAAVLERVRVKQVLTNGTLGQSATGRHLLTMLDRRHIPQARVAAGDRLTGLGGVEMMVLHPPPDGVPGMAGRSNDNSVVMRMTNGAVSFLLCGDLEEQGVPWVMRWGASLRSTVLKVPHHGSALGASTRAFFAQVQPDASILSVGNLHHLPSLEVLSALAAMGTSTYLTRRDGAVTVRTDGQQLLVKTFRSMK